jgi:hypothetical protein
MGSACWSRCLRGVPRPVRESTGKKDRAKVAPVILARSLALTVACLASGCATSGGTWNDAGYRQEYFGYEVAFRDAKTKAIAGADWQLENYRADSTASDLVEKTGPAYVAIREQDVDQDGTISESEKIEEPTYDLRLTNRKNNGVIWLKAHPFLPEDADQDLEVILANYADSLSGGGLYAQGNLFGVERDKVRNFTSVLASKQIAPVGSHDALVGTIEIAEVDRLKQDPGQRSGIVKVALVKIRCLTVGNCRRLSYRRARERELRRWPVVDCRGTPCHARTGLLVVGYYNTPEYFAAGVPDFEELLKRISFPDAQPLPVPALRTSQGSRK